MRVLMIEDQSDLALIWKRHLERNGASVAVAQTADLAMRHLNHHAVDVLIVDLNLPEGSALVIADYAGYRRPDAKVIFVTSDKFFADGSIFQHVANAAMMLPADTSPDDMVAVVEHCVTGSAGPR